MLQRQIREVFFPVLPFAVHVLRCAFMPCQFSPMNTLRHFWFGLKQENNLRFINCHRVHSEESYVGVESFNHSLQAFIYDNTDKLQYFSCIQKPNITWMITIGSDLLLLFLSEIITRNKRPWCKPLLHWQPELDLTAIRRFGHYVGRANKILQNS